MGVNEDFFIFLMIRCSGYAGASGIRGRLFSSSQRIFSLEMIMLY